MDQPGRKAPQSFDDVWHRFSAGDDIRRRVRANAAPAAIAAALLGYFGFMWLAEPSGTSLFEQASWVFYHTLRLGGVAMVLLAVASLSGAPLVLLVDGVASLFIGVLLVISGLLMAAGGGVIGQTLINVICGVLFIAAGLRNGSEYFVFRALTGDAPSPAPTTRTDARSPAPGAVVRTRPASPAGTGSRAAAVPPKPTGHPAPQPAPQASASDSPAAARAGPGPAEPAKSEPEDDGIGGFLASLSEGGPPPRP
jgi:hypothetical protein